MSDFKARKKMLVTESEVYRELLKLEIQTFKVYGVHTRRRLSSFRNYLPWVAISGLPILAQLFGRKKKKSSLGRLTSLALVAWKAYQQFAPLFGRKSRTEPSQTAAEEYLSKRL